MKTETPSNLSAFPTGFLSQLHFLSLPFDVSSIIKVPSVGSPPKLHRFESASAITDFGNLGTISRYPSPASTALALAPIRSPSNSLEFPTLWKLTSYEARSLQAYVLYHKSSCLSSPSGCFFAFSPAIDLPGVMVYSTHDCTRACQGGNHRWRRDLVRSVRRSSRRARPCVAFAGTMWVRRTLGVGSGQGPRAG